MRREVLAFDGRGQSAVAIDDRGLQRMRDQPFLGPVLNAERVADALDLRRIAGEEVPAGSAGALGRGVLREDLRRVVPRIEADRQEDEIAIHPRREPVAQRLEVLDHPRAVVRQRAARVDEGDGDDLALQRRQARPACPA